MGVQHRFETRDKYDRWMTLGNCLGRTHPGALLAVDAAGKGWGLDRVRLQAAGYRLRYVVHYDRDDGEPIRDVKDLNDGTIKQLYQQGFTYGVLEKTSDSAGSAPSPRITRAVMQTT